MKALIINSQGHSEEAFALAKEALRNDMKSHITWHVYGLLWRSQKNFEEASKAYKFALKIAPDSQQIQRDLAWLQVQMRDYQGFIQTRRTILQERSNVRSHWTAMAIAYHIAGELAGAEKTLTAFEGTLKQVPPRSDIENSEAAMYKNSIIAEMGETERALEHLESINHIVLDRVAWMEMRARYLLQLGRKEDAEQAYRALLERNNEYRAYYDGLESALGLDKADKESLQRLEELYQSYAEKNERTDAPRRIPLDFLTGIELIVNPLYILNLFRKQVSTSCRYLPATDVDQRRPVHFCKRKGSLSGCGKEENHSRTCRRLRLGRYNKWFDRRQNQWHIILHV